MTKCIRNIYVACIALALSAAGAATAYGAETGGTLSGGGSATTTEQSYVDGGLVATIITATSTPEPSGGEGAVTTGGSSGRSLGSHRHTVVLSSSGIQSDGSLAGMSDYSGTGGGYDSEVDAYLASARGESVAGASGALAVDDAIAYNTSRVPSLEPSNIAAVANSGSSEGGRIWTTVILGLALLGLAAYAINAYVAYRKGY